MGLPDLCEPARALDVDRLIEQFTKLQDRAPEVRQHLELRNAELRRQLATQFEELTMLLLPASAQPAPGEQRQAGASSASSGPTRGTPAKRA
jgi:hypothetical protein